MFDEVPARAPPPPPSQRAAVATFGLTFAVFLSGAVIAWIRWSRPLSLVRKLDAVEFIVCSILSGVFLLTAKAVTPEANRRRMTILGFVFLVLQLIDNLLR
jgi:hypothetical protein